jgi:WD40 repeat protein
MRSPVISVWDANASREELTIQATQAPDPQLQKRRGEHISYFQNDLTWLWMTPDGLRVLAGYSNRVLRTWDATTGKLLRETLGIFNGRWLALSRDGSHAASQQPDRSVRFFDLQSGRLLRVLVTPDHERASLSPGTPTPLPPTSDLPEVVDISPSLGRGGRIALSAESRWVVLGFDTNLICWELDTGRVLLEELGDFDVCALVIDRHERLAVAGSRSGELRVIDLARGLTTSRLEGHQGAILDVAFGGNGQLLSAGADDTLRVWDLDAGSEILRQSVRGGGVEEVVISRDGRFAFSIYGDTAVLSQINPPRRVGSLSLDHGISAISVTADGQRVVLGDESGRLHFVQVEH